MSSKTSRLFIVDYKYEQYINIEEKLESLFNNVRSMLEGRSDEEAHHTLNSMRGDQNFNDMISGGFLYGLLVEPLSFKKYFSNLSNFVNGDWNKCICNTNVMIVDYYWKFKPEARKQLLHFFAEAIKIGVPGIDSCIYNLLYSIGDGMNHIEYYIITQEVAEILNENRNWLFGIKRNSILFPISILVFSRFLSDTYHQQNQAMNGTSGNTNSMINDRSKSSIISLCDVILRDRFPELVSLLGKDLILVLMRLSKIVQFIPHWKNLFYRPESLMDNFTGFRQLMIMPCSSKVFTKRVSGPLWRSIDFLIRKPNLMEQGKHFEWLSKTHLSTPDSGSLRAELIRVAWNINATMFFDQTPTPAQIMEVRESRANLLFWLMRFAKSGAELQMCKLMLFWEWIFFDINSQTAFNAVEPAFSVIKLSLIHNPHMANSLLDFIIRECQVLYPPLTGAITNSVIQALKTLDANGMPIMPVFNHAKIDMQIKEALKCTFPEFYKKTSIADTLAEPTDIIDFNAIRESTNTPVLPDTKHPSSLSFTKKDVSETCETRQGKPKMKQQKKDDSYQSFSNNDKSKNDKFKETKNNDNEHNNINKKRKLLSTDESPYPTGSSLSFVLHDENNSSKHLEKNQNKNCFMGVEKSICEELRDSITGLITFIDGDLEKAVAAMQKLMDELVQNTFLLSREQIDSISDIFLKIFANHLSNLPYFLYGFAQKNIKSLFYFPFYELFRTLCQCSKNDDKSPMKKIILILSLLKKRFRSVGYLFLFYIKNCESQDELTEQAAIDAYSEFCLEHDGDAVTHLQIDLEYCSIDDHPLFIHLFPYVYEKFLPGCSAYLIHLLCRTLDTTSLTHLIGEILTENFKILTKQKFFTEIVTQSLEWTPFEQNVLWQLFQAEGLTMDWVNASGVISRITYEKYPEAASGVLLLIKNMESEPELSVLKNLLKELLLRPPEADLFTTHGIKTLLQYEDNVRHVADWINRLIGTAISNGDITGGNVTQQALKKSNKVLTVENILAHLDKFRIECNSKDKKNAREFLSCSILWEKLCYARKNAKMAELIQGRFSEFYSVLEVMNEDNQGERHRKAKQAGKIKQEFEIRDSSPSARKKKKRKRGSDSDEN